MRIMVLWGFIEICLENSYEFIILVYSPAQTTVSCYLTWIYRILLRNRNEDICILEWR